jgi:protein-L-isoaspartate(D-aspartate) O-methyltransferase
VEVVCGPLERGWLDSGPYDAVLIHGTVGHFPEKFLRQLKEDGRLICTRGAGPRPEVTLIIKTSTALGYRPLFNATAPELPEFSKASAFTF